MKKIDWRLVMAMTLTLVYLAALSVYVSNSIGFAKLPTVSIERLGNFLEGAFAPVAFLWLVVGYFLQQKELAQNTQAIQMQNEEIKKTGEQAMRQAEAIAKSEEHQRRESFIHISEIVQRHLGTIASYLYLSSQTTDASILDDDQIDEIFERAQTSPGDVFLFEMMRLLGLADPKYRYKLVFGTEIRTKHSEEYVKVFERLAAEAKAVDETGMIAESIQGTIHGRFYNIIQRVKEDPPAGFTYGVYDFDPDDLEGEVHPYKRRPSQAQANPISST